MWEENILQLVGCLPGMCKALGSNPNNTETGWRCACLWPQAFRDTGRKIWCSKSFSDMASSKPVWDLWDPFFKTEKQANTTTTNSKPVGELIDKLSSPDMSLGWLEHDLLHTKQHLHLRKLHMWGRGGSKWGSMGWKWGRMSKHFEVPAHTATALLHKTDKFPPISNHSWSTEELEERRAGASTVKKVQASRVPAHCDSKVQSHP